MGYYVTFCQIFQGEIHKKMGGISRGICEQMVKYNALLRSGRLKNGKTEFAGIKLKQEKV